MPTMQYVKDNSVENRRRLVHIVINSCTEWFVVVLESSVVDTELRQKLEWH